MTTPLSDTERHTLGLILAEIQDNRFPAEQELKRRDDVQPWVVDDLVAKGLAYIEPPYLRLTISGLRALNTPDAVTELEWGRAVYEGLKKARLQDSAKRWGTSDLSRFVELPAASGRDIIVGRLLPMLAPHRVFSMTSQTPGGLIGSVEITDAIYDVDPFSTAPAYTAPSLEGDVTLRVQNFRGVRAAEWSFDGVSLIAGANGSGKTTLLEALSFFHSYYQLGWSGAVNALGGTAGLRHLGAPPQEPVRLSLQIGELLWEIELAPELGGGFDPNPGEAVRHGGEVLLRRAARSANWYLGTRKRQSSSGQCCLRMVADGDHAEATLLRPFAALVQTVRFYQSYNLRDVRERPDKPNGDEFLRGTGQNLYAVLRNWQGAPIRFDGRFAWVMETLREAFPRLIAHIEFDSAGSLVLARFYPEGSADPDHHLPLQSASDGMLVGLLHLTAVAGCTEGAIIAIDEMENQLHPHAIRVILAAIRELAEERSLRVLLSTHSPVLMNDFKHHPEQFFVTEPGHERFPVPLDELHDPEWLAHFALGDLYDRLEFGAPEMQT